MPRSLQVNPRQYFSYGLFRNPHENLPLRHRLTDPWSRNLGAEIDPALRRGLRPAAALLVPSLRREKDDGVRRVDEHLRRDDDVLMDPKGHAGEGLADVPRLRERLEEGTAYGIEKLESDVV